MHSPVHFLRRCPIIAVALTAFAAHGQTENDADWNHFGINFRLGLNIKAKFSNVGTFTGQAAPPLSGGVDHNYSDGFVRLDSSGDRGGVTWNWGYQNASQISGNGTLQMRSASSDGASSEVNNDPRLGLEVNYARDLGCIGSGRWGLKVALGFTDVKVRDTESLSGDVSLTTDAYSLGGITPPRAPYAGSFNGPGPVISDTPTRSMAIIPGGAAISGSRQLDAWLYDFRFGPYLEIPLVQQLALQVGGGFAAGVADSTFSFADTTTTSGGTVQASGSGNHTSAKVGFYGEVGLAYHIVPDASIFGGGQFEYLGEFNQDLGGRVAEMDLRHSYYFVVGVQFHF
jgi:hypothetical protein